MTTVNYINKPQPKQPINGINETEKETKGNQKNHG